MARSYSLLILPQYGTRVRRLVLPRWAIRLTLYTSATLLGIGGWFVGDLMRQKHQLISSNISQQRQMEKGRQLRVEAREETKTLRARLGEQREKLSRLQERVEASQRLLAKWNGLRKKIHASLPRKHRSSLTGKQLVEELETSLTSLEGELKGLISSIPSRWPTRGWLSSGFGKRRSPWTGEGEFHSGIDIANRTGTPVEAPGDGVVSFAGVKNLSGRSIVLDHGQGITTHYAHLSQLYVKKGDRVRRDQKIGDVGNGGRSTNPHLHYEVRVNGVPIDPRRDLLNGRRPRLH